MKQSVVISLALLLIGNLTTFAAGFSLEAGHFSVNGGPLTMTDQNSVPLTDGCLVEILADTAGQGMMPPQRDGAPGLGNALLSEFLNKSKHKDNPAVFALNGQEKLNAGGGFLSPLIREDDPPACRIWMRVFNDPDPARATAYWDSPFYRIVPGPQQISFLRSEWTFHPFHANAAPPAAAALTPAMDAYPNPFNSSSRIAFTVEKSSDVQLNIFDIQGRLVRTLVSGTQPAGSQSVLFEAGSLATGVYFLRMQQDGRQAFVKRLQLVR